MNTELERTFIVVNQLGLHARAASKLVSLAKSFSSEIIVTKAHTSVDAKSIMKVMLLAAPLASEIHFSVRGEDASAAMAELTELVESGFGEGDHLNTDSDTNPPS